MEHKQKRFAALRAAFPLTLPVLTGYLFLGMAYGILMQKAGYNALWTGIVSALVYAGSGQFAGVALLTTAFDPLQAVLITLVINARHVFYGLSMLDKYRNMGIAKPYLIFGMTDETFSIVCSVQPPRGVDRRRFFFLITLLDHGYWILGSVLGCVAGGLIRFDTTGLDFALTALFVVIFIDQWIKSDDHRAALIGVGCSVLCLIIFGGENFIIPAMILIVLVLMLLRKRIEGRAAP